MGNGISRSGAEQRRSAGTLLFSHRDRRSRFRGADSDFYDGRMHSGRVHETVAEMDRRFWADTRRYRRVELVQHDLSEDVLSHSANDFPGRHLDDRCRVRYAADR